MPAPLALTESATSPPAGVEHRLPDGASRGDRGLAVGHVFDVEEPRLRLALDLSIATGLGLVVIEAYPGSRWSAQGRARSC